ncbi:MAG: hypothetical protein WDW36_000413 [Sanguina aurantia]
MSEPVGLGLSLDDLIKRSSTANRKQDGGAKREGVPPIGVKGGGVVKRSTAPAPRSFNNSAAGRSGNTGARPGGRGGAAAFTAPSHATFANNNNSERASFVPSKLDTSYDDAGALNIRLKDTNIVSVAPNGTITLTSGGWKTPTTLNCINRVLNLIGASIGSQGSANDGNWQVSAGTVLTRFEDGMKLPSKGHITANRAQLIYDGLQPGAAPPQGRPQHAPAFPNGAGNRNIGAGFQQHGPNNNNSSFRAGGAGGFDNRRNGQQQQQQTNGGGMHVNGASGGGFNSGNGFNGGGSSAGANMDMNDPAVAAVMMAGFRLGVQRSMAAAAGGGMGNPMMGMGGMGMGGMGMGMSGMGMGMNSAGLASSHSLGSMYGSASAAAAAAPQAFQAATLQPSRQQYDRARAAAAAAAAGGGLDMMDDDQAVAPMQQQHQQRPSGVRSGNVFNRLTAGVVGGGGQMMDGQSSEEARRLRAQGRYAY